MQLAPDLTAEFLWELAQNALSNDTHSVSVLIYEAPCRSSPCVFLSVGTSVPRGRQPLSMTSKTSWRTSLPAKSLYTDRYNHVQTHMKGVTIEGTFNSVFINRSLWGLFSGNGAICVWRFCFVFISCEKASRLFFISLFIFEEIFQILTP